MKLEIKNLAFKYSEDTIFEDISFSLESGDIFFLLGPNGVGKTTLIKVLVGILRTKTGQILINGEDIIRWPRKKAAQYISYVPQGHNAYFPYKVLDVVLMGRTPYLSRYSVPSKADEDIACDILESLGILHLKDKSYKQISGGERQLVLISRALAQNPKVLVMDEPTSSLDFGNQIKVLQHIKQLAGKDIAVIISTHMPDHALCYATKAALMKDGRILCCGEPQTVINSENLKEIYNVDIKVINASLYSEKSAFACIPG